MLYSAYTRPWCGNVTTTDAKALETIQSGALRVVFGTPRWTKTVNLRTDAQVPTLAERIKHTTANFIIKESLRDDHPDHVHTALLRHHEGQRGQDK